jgi:hypothetical protein
MQWITSSAGTSSLSYITFESSINGLCDEIRTKQVLSGFEYLGGSGCPGSSTGCPSSSSGCHGSSSGCPSSSSGCPNSSNGCRSSSSGCPSSSSEWCPGSSSGCPSSSNTGCPGWSFNASPQYLQAIAEKVPWRGMTTSIQICNYTYLFITTFPSHPIRRYIITEIETSLNSLGINKSY